MGGAGLVFAEMTCVTPDARITPGCLGLWNDEQAAPWKRLVDLIHSHRPAKVGVHLGHAGPKGATRSRGRASTSRSRRAMAARFRLRLCPICSAAKFPAR